jgi:hypothetical protein
MHLRDDATLELSKEQRTELEKVARSHRVDDGRWRLAGGYW